MRNSPKLFRVSRGFSLVEMLVVIAIIAVLAVITMLGVNRLRDGSRRAVSIGNLRQLGVGLTMYVADNNNYLPLARRGSAAWPQVIYPYVPSQSVFLRPGSKDVPASAAEPEGYFKDVTANTPEGIPIRWNYIINGGDPKLPIPETRENPYVEAGYSRPFSDLTRPDRTVMMAEGKEYWWFNAEARANSGRMYRWRNGTSNVLFADGSTRNLNPRTELRDSDFLVDQPRS